MVDIQFSKRVSHFVPPKQWASMREAKEAEQEGKEIIHFERGDYRGPDFALPDHIYDAAKEQFGGHIEYSPGPGIPDLREAIANKVEEERGRPTDPEEVVVTAGAKSALTMSLLTMLEDGDEVIYPNPGYPPDETWAKYAGTKILHTPLTKPDWQYNVDELSDMITGRTKLLIINSPQRPNGHIVENVEAIADVAKQHEQLLVISDEIFTQVTYEKDDKSITSVPGMPERSILIDTFSKEYGMTGFRIGYAVAPEPIAEKLSIFFQDFMTNVAVFIQNAALAAIEGPQEWVEEKRQTLMRKRDKMVEALDDISGIECQKPPGAFYAFPNITGTGMDSQEFTDKMMREQGVAVVPGTAFGSRGEGHVRLTFSVPDDEIEEGIKRIRNELE